MTHKYSDRHLSHRKHSHRERHKHRNRSLDSLSSSRSPQKTGQNNRNNQNHKNRTKSRNHRENSRQKRGDSVVSYGSIGDIGTGKISQANEKEKKQQSKPIEEEKRGETILQNSSSESKKRLSFQEYKKEKGIVERFNQSFSSKYSRSSNHFKRHRSRSPYRHNRERREDRRKRNNKRRKERKSEKTKERKRQFQDKKVEYNKKINYERILEISRDNQRRGLSPNKNKVSGFSDLRDQSNIKPQPRKENQKIEKMIEQIQNLNINEQEEQKERECETPIMEQQNDMFEVIQHRGFQQKPKIKEPFQYFGKISPSNEVDNLMTYDLPQEKVDKIQALFNGWLAIITKYNVTFLSPNMINHQTYITSNVITIAEFITDYKIHNVTLISPTLIEVMICKDYDYQNLTKSYSISFNSIWMTQVIAFPKSNEIAFVSEEKQQQIWIFDLYLVSQNPNKRYFIEGDARTGEIEDNEILLLKFFDNTLIVRTKRDYFYFYEKKFDNKNMTTLQFMHRIKEFREKNGNKLLVEDIIVNQKLFIYLLIYESNLLYCFKYNEDYKIKEYRVIQYTVELLKQPIDRSPNRIHFDIRNQHVFIADREDIYYSTVPEFMEDEVNSENIGFGVENPDCFAILKGTRDQYRLIFAESRLRLMNWNIMRQQ